MEPLRTLLCPLLAAFSFTVASPAFADSASPACAVPNDPLFARFHGHYTLALTIGERLFHDQLEIRCLTPNAEEYEAGFTGHFSVPEAGISEPVLNGNIRYDYEGYLGVFTLQFDVLVHENGAEFPVYFEVLRSSGFNCAHEGVAYLNAEKTEILGRFIMTKNDPQPRCPR